MSLKITNFAKMISDVETEFDVDEIQEGILNESEVGQEGLLDIFKKLFSDQKTTYLQEQIVTRKKQLDTVLAAIRTNDEGSQTVLNSFKRSAFICVPFTQAKMAIQATPMIFRGLETLIIGCSKVIKAWGLEGSRQEHIDLQLDDIKKLLSNVTKEMKFITVSYDADKLDFSVEPKDFPKKTYQVKTLRELSDYMLNSIRTYEQFLTVYKAIKSSVNMMLKEIAYTERMIEYINDKGATTLTEDEKQQQMYELRSELAVCKCLVKIVRLTEMYVDHFAFPNPEVSKSVGKENMEAVSIPTEDPTTEEDPKPLDYEEPITTEEVIKFMARRGIKVQKLDETIYGSEEYIAQDFLKQKFSQEVKTNFIGLGNIIERIKEWWSPTIGGQIKLRTNELKEMLVAIKAVKVLDEAKQQMFLDSRGKDFYIGQEAFDKQMPLMSTALKGMTTMQLIMTEASVALMDTKPLKNLNKEDENFRKRYNSALINFAKNFTVGTLQTSTNLSKFAWWSWSSSLSGLPSRGKSAKTLQELEIAVTKSIDLLQEYIDEVDKTWRSHTDCMNHVYKNVNKVYKEDKERFEVAKEFINNTVNNAYSFATGLLYSCVTYLTYKPTGKIRGYESFGGGMDDIIGGENTGIKTTDEQIDPATHEPIEDVNQIDEIKEGLEGLGTGIAVALAALFIYSAVSQKLDERKLRKIAEKIAPRVQELEANIKKNYEAYATIMKDRAKIITGINRIEPKYVKFNITENVEPWSFEEFMKLTVLQASKYIKKDYPYRTNDKTIISLSKNIIVGQESICNGNLDVLEMGNDGTDIYNETQYHKLIQMIHKKVVDKIKSFNTSSISLHLNMDGDDGASRIDLLCDTSISKIAITEIAKEIEIEVKKKD